MAQQDTGFGWNAKEEWLTSGENIPIASISVFSSSTLPAIPTGTTIADIRATDFWYYNNRDYHDCFVVEPGTVAYCFYVGNQIVYCSSKQVSGAYNGIYSGRWRYDYSGPVNQMSNLASPDSTTGLYYGYVSSASSGKNPNIPTYNTISEGLAAISVYESEFVKTNPGYAVACLAKWKTPNATTFESPILISTNSNFVEMSTTATGVSFAKLNVLYEGRQFYMGFFDNPYTGDMTSNFPVIDRSYYDAPTFTLEELFKYIAKDVYANIKVTVSPDPYQEGDGSGEAGGDGEEDSSDDVDFTDPPSTSIGATGLLTIFCPNLYQLQSLGSYMWATFDVDNWRKIIANPMDAILGLHTIPIPAIITGTKAVKVAGIDTTIDMSYTTVRYIRRSLGTCEIPKKWGAYLDYSPYTKISIFLPFIGFKELDADDVMGKTIALQYMIDILTGACVAELKCENTVLYSWSGNCANEVPISGSDWRGAIASAIGIAATVAGTALVTGGATAPMTASMVASVGANSMNLKPTINRSGAISGSAGYMSQKRPYIIRSIPNLVIPTDQNKFIGYPSFVTTSLGSLTGYNEISSIHLEGIPATGNELAEIETLLKGGVIF